MYYLIVDTCSWIEVCKKSIDTCQKISELVAQEKIRLIVPQVVIDEWNTHKESKISSQITSSINGKIKNALSISEYLGSDEARIIRDVIERLKSDPDKIENYALQGVNIVEDIFDHPSTIILPVTTKSKLQAVDFALAKKAPFHKKNSMADALILFCFVDYIAEEGLENNIFVSNNTKDFGDGERGVHADLKDLFDEHQVRYFPNIGLALNEIESGLIRNEVIVEFEESLLATDVARDVARIAKVMRDAAAIDLAGAVEAMRESAAYDVDVASTIRESVAVDVAKVAKAVRDAAAIDLAGAVEAMRESAVFDVDAASIIRESTAVDVARVAKAMRDAAAIDLAGAVEAMRESAAFDVDAASIIRESTAVDVARIAKVMRDAAAIDLASIIQEMADHRDEEE